MELRFLSNMATTGLPQDPSLMLANSDEAKFSERPIAATARGDQARAIHCYMTALGAEPLLWEPIWSWPALPVPSVSLRVGLAASLDVRVCSRN